MLRNLDIYGQFAPKAHDSILVLLLLDEQFRALFRDSQFHAMVQSPSEINKLVGFINGLIPRERTDEVREILPPKATTLLIVSGYGQEGLAGTRLQSPFVVEVRDQYGEPFSGATVVFRVTGGSLSSTRETTNSFGQAQTTLTLGPSAGANSVEASVSGISPSQTFTATAIAPGEQQRATTLSIVSGNNQSGESGMSLGQAFIVGVLDQDKGLLMAFLSLSASLRVGDNSRVKCSNEYGQSEITAHPRREGINKVAQVFLAFQIRKPLRLLLLERQSQLCPLNFHGCIG